MLSLFGMLFLLGVLMVLLANACEDRHIRQRERVRPFHKTRLKMVQQHLDDREFFEAAKRD